MNVCKIIEIYDKKYDNNIFGSVELNKYKTNCFKYCPYYLRRCGLNEPLPKTVNEVRDDYEENMKKYKNNYELFYN